MARFFRAITERWIGRPKKTLELTEGMVESALGTFHIIMLSSVLQFRGTAFAEIGQIEKGMESLRKAISDFYSISRGKN